MAVWSHTDSYLQVVFRNSIPEGSVFASCVGQFLFGPICPVKAINSGEFSLTCQTPLLNDSQTPLSGIPSLADFADLLAKSLISLPNNPQPYVTRDQKSWKPPISLTDRQPVFNLYTAQSKLILYTISISMRKRSGCTPRFW